MNNVYEAPETIRKMLIAAWALIYSLGPELRAEAMYDMDDPRRFDWDFIPKPDRVGVPLHRLDSHQRTLVHLLLAAGLSERGYTQALAIMSMENILRERETPALGVAVGDFRHSDSYFISFYGRPAFEDTWGWRLLGHHLSLSYTIIDQRYLTMTPSNMGAQPAQAGVLSPLSREEQLAFELLGSLGAALGKRAVIHDVAPADYCTRQVPFIGRAEYPDFVDLGIPSYQITEHDRQALKFEKDRPAGISGVELDEGQRRLLSDIIDCYIGRAPEEVAARHRERVLGRGIDSVYFAWAGATRQAAPHYYRIQTPDILIEFANAIDSGNHIHSVWRDLRNDLGHDLLISSRERIAVHGHHLDTRLTPSVPDSEQPAELQDTREPGRVDGRRAVGRAQLPHRGPQVGLDGLRAQPEFGRYLHVAGAYCHEPECIQLTRGQSANGRGRCSRPARQVAA